MKGSINKKPGAARRRASKNVGTGQGSNIAKDSSDSEAALRGFWLTSDSRRAGANLAANTSTQSATPILPQGIRPRNGR